MTRVISKRLVRFSLPAFVIHKSSNRVNTNLAIENSRESSSVDYASLSVILISVLLMCFLIVLLANEAKRSANWQVTKNLRWCVALS